MSFPGAISLGIVGRFSEVTSVEIDGRTYRGNPGILGPWDNFRSNHGVKYWRIRRWIGVKLPGRNSGEISLDIIWEIAAEKPWLILERLIEAIFGGITTRISREVLECISWNTSGGINGRLSKGIFEEIPEESVSFTESCNKSLQGYHVKSLENYVKQFSAEFRQGSLGESLNVFLEIDLKTSWNSSSKSLQSNS